ncbi:MAG: helix-turn-helix transcriptional regulator [Desulfarculaceae bacterium]|jgi:transcriptional regulator with XRE-family HTH domain
MGLLGKKTGLRIKSARQSSNMTQEELASAIGLSGPSQIGRYEKGLLPPENMLEKISEVLGVSVERLLVGGEDEGPSGSESKISDKVALPADEDGEELPIPEGADKHYKFLVESLLAQNKTLTEHNREHLHQIGGLMELLKNCEIKNRRLQNELEKAQAKLEQSDSDLVGGGDSPGKEVN